MLPPNNESQPVAPSEGVGTLRGHAIPVLLLTLIASIPRWYDIGGRALWLDEAHTYSRASLPVSELIDEAIRNLHTPPYFLGIRYWMSVFGSSETALRAPSALLGTLTVIAIYFAGAFIGSRRLGFVAAFLLAVWPDQVHYGQEARMYAAVTLGTAIAIAAQVWLVMNPHAAAINWIRPASSAPPGDARAARIAWSSLILGCLLAAWMHNLGSLALASSGVAGLVTLWHSKGQRRELLRNGAFAYGLIGAAWAWWLPVMASQQARLAVHAWGLLTPEHVHRVLERLLFVATNNIWIEAALCAVAIAGCWSLRRQPMAMVVLLSFTLLPTLIVIIASLKQPLLAPRLLLPITLPMVVLLAAGLGAIRVRWLSYAMTVTLLAWVVGVQLPRYFATRKVPPWRVVTELLVAENDEDVAVLYAPSKRAMDPLFYYLSHIEGGDEIKPWAAQKRTVRRVVASKRWIWLIVADETDEPKTLAKMALIDDHATLTWSREFAPKFHLYKYLVNRHDR